MPLKGIILAEGKDLVEWETGLGTHSSGIHNVNVSQHCDS